MTKELFVKDIMAKPTRSLAYATRVPARDHKDRHAHRIAGCKVPGGHDTHVSEKAFTRSNSVMRPTSREFSMTGSAPDVLF